MLRTRTIVYAGLVAAAYAVVTLAFAPISYQALQFRVSEMLKPLALLGPTFAIGFAFGTFLSNLASPFGVWDWGTMPVVDFVAAIVCWQVGLWQLAGVPRRTAPLLACTLQAIIISAGVAIFPLGMALRAPFWPAFLPVLISELILIVGGYFIWSKSGGLDTLRKWVSAARSN
jgi:uncharacterized membrane protein